MGIRRRLKEMCELKQIDELTNSINLLDTLEIAKNSALIGNEILKKNYNKIQTISSKGRKGERIPVKNSDSKLVVFATVKTRNIVQVN